MLNFPLEGTVTMKGVTDFNLMRAIPQEVEEIALYFKFWASDGGGKGSIRPHLRVSAAILA